ncbi:NepR family anti-sigma factor [Parvibaculum sp.]|uniref:NepR family anti-sigma factor n=1 Tax=Parvibaculum sp. TaxID=2024848 RepID=UPI0027313D0F|nr:NepR family anti-sigma factor [Parvibaculum sp.]MDP1626157.1 NepR family anti-sigma factor [Parvibaculum sp.]MDP2151474.1 NepR family anti-sigma factor [Parvibaculum sp.]MDP3329196.1 NepR family anti-sigma factor [Parvibaculum sp.]
MSLTLRKISEPFDLLGVDMRAVSPKVANSIFAPEEQTSSRMMNDRLNEWSRNFVGQGRRDAPVRTAVLGRRLREMYRDVADEPIPAEFTRLLEKLDAGKKN